MCREYKRGDPEALSHTASPDEIAIQHNRNLNSFASLCFSFFSFEDPDGRKRTGAVPCGRNRKVLAEGGET